MWREIQRWRGVILMAAAVASTIWLAVSNQLVLYIHPRYIVFSVVMAVIGLVLAVLSVRSPTSSDEHDHDHDAKPRGIRSAIPIAAVALSAIVLVSMTALPSATLSSATASQRDITGSTVGANAQTVSGADAASTEAFAKFTVVDWSSLLRQTSDLEFYADKPVDVVGFITPDAEDPDNLFYVSRFVVTCCAVDAQPAGVPVYLKDWRSQFAVDDWVNVTGRFGTNPSDRSALGVALAPEAIEKVEQPVEPYLY